MTKPNDPTPDGPGNPLAGLQHLADAARRIDDDTSSAARVWHKLEASFGPLDHVTLGLGSAAAHAATAGTGGATAMVAKTVLVKSVIASFVLGAALAGAGVEVLHQRSMPKVPTVPAPAADATPHAQPTPPAVTNSVASPIDSTPPLVVPPSTPIDGTKRKANSVQPKATPSIDDERLLIDRARTALMRGEFDSAQRALTLHRLNFQHGVFVEEREAMDALVHLRTNSAGARAKAQTFLSNHPESAFAATIEAELEKTELDR